MSEIYDGTRALLEDICSALEQIRCAVESPVNWQISRWWPPDDEPLTVRAPEGWEPFAVAPDGAILLRRPAR